MGEFFNNILLSIQLIPQEHCYLWETELVWLHVVSNWLIAVADYAIRLMLVYFIHKQLILPSLALVESAQLKVTNEALLDEITSCKAAESALLKANAQLEIRVAQRTAELTSLNASLSKEIAEHQRAEAKFRQMFERNMMIGLLFWDIEGNILDANDAFLKMVGYTRAELVSGAVRWKDLTPSEYSALDYKAIAQVAETGSAPPYEKEYIRKDGTRFPILIGGAFLEGSQQQGVCFVLDITQQREKAQQLEQALMELQCTQAQLVQTEKMASLGQLVAGVAHEINNPTSFISCNIPPAQEYAMDLLHLIQLYQQHYPQPVAEIVELMEHIDIEFITTDFPKLLASMQEGADRITQIVCSLRNFSRLDEGERKQVDIHEGIDNTLLILQHQLRPHSGHAEIQIFKEYGKLPPVECYPGQLNQVFMNIISNAIDALENQPAPRMITICTTLLDGGSRVGIQIQDNGPGMSIEVKTRLFDPFFTTKPVGRGTGLGLSISYQIVVEKHCGVLKCFSQPGQGAEFWIEIPLQINCEKKSLSQQMRVIS